MAPRLTFCIFSAASEIYTLFNLFKRKSFYKLVQSAAKIGDLNPPLYVRGTKFSVIIMWVIRSKRLSHEQAHAWKAYTPLRPRSADPWEEVVLPKPAEWLIKL